MTSFLEFIERSNSAGSQQELSALFKKALLDLGIDKFIYSMARGSFAHAGKTHHGLAQSYPEDWMKHYAANNYLQSDPTYRFALKQKGAFTWTSLRERLPLSKKEKLVMNEATEAGLANGITLSLHGAYGEVMGFGFASNIRRDDLNKNELSLLYAIAGQFNLAYSNFGEQKPVDIKLSDKQREVLQWTALGKTRELTGEIMNITTDTVDYHFKNIYKKLRCNDRISAVLKAVQYGLVRV